MDGLERAYREEWTTVVAALARRLDDLQAAEDAAAEAFAAAARTWPRDGIPPNPGGWLTVTAWRKAVDQLRRQAIFEEKRAELESLAGLESSDVVTRDGGEEPVDESLPRAPKGMDGFEAILTLLRKATGADLTAYKPPTI